MRSQHIWTEKDGDGRKREVRATKFGGIWRFQSKMAGEADWTYYDIPPFEDLLILKQIVGRKYRRRRASADDVVSIEKLISERNVDE
ncbi:MAG TPA: hypothetical protein DCO65_07035 [Spartobacteria bacterium]|jgi:hypothetical protein|nr:hypothetical protein [Spartobacteria bacterium]